MKSISMTMTRTLIVERHPVVMAGLNQIIQEQPDLEVVGQAHEGGQAIEKAKELQPDLVVLDTSLRGTDAIQLTQAVLGAAPAAKVVVFGGAQEKAKVLEILSAGACGYVSKEAAPEEIIRALRSVARGEDYVDGNLLRSLYPTESDAANGKGINGRNELTERESTVLRLVAHGLIAKEIAAELRVSAKSVETYKTRGMRKLGIRGRPEVVRYAYRQGWMEELRKTSEQVAVRNPCETGARAC